MRSSRISLVGGSFKNFQLPAQAEDPQLGQLAISDVQYLTVNDGTQWHDVASTQPPWTPDKLEVPAKILLDENSELSTIDNACQQWYDRSGNDWHFSQTTAGKRPLVIADGLNSLRVLRFDGTNDNMSCVDTVARSMFSSTGAGWCFSVFRRRATSLKTAPIMQSREASTANSRIACYAGINISDRQNMVRLYTRRINGETVTQTGTSFAVGTDWTAAMFLARWSSGVGSTIVNGNTPESASMLSSGNTSSGVSHTAIYLGSEGETTFGDLDIACLLLGSGSIPTNAEIDKLFGYYMHRYGLQSNLPVAHPFRYAPP